MVGPWGKDRLFQSIPRSSGGGTLPTMMRRSNTKPSHGERFQSGSPSPCRGENRGTPRSPLGWGGLWCGSVPFSMRSAIALLLPSSSQAPPWLGLKKTSLWWPLGSRSTRTFGMNARGSCARGGHSCTLNLPALRCPPWSCTYKQQQPPRHGGVRREGPAPQSRATMWGTSGLSCSPDLLDGHAPASGSNLPSAVARREGWAPQSPATIPETHAHGRPPL